MSKSKFSEEEALDILLSNSGVKVINKSIIFDKDFKGFRGLTSCAAFDYLKNYHNYR